MKTFNLLCHFLAAAVSLLFISETNASWLHGEKNYFSNIYNSSDSVSPADDKQFLSSLRDEKGNKIIEETDAISTKIFNGLNAGEGLGTSVASAGDVNGDGYDDLIVSAMNYSTNTGRVYIYYGGLNMNTVADLILTGESINNYFGSSVSSAGDVNGDGYADVIVGAMGHNSNTGKAYLYFGGAAMNNTADLTMLGESVSNYFGIACTSMDMNGDGYSDVIVGAEGYAVNTGRAYLFLGGAVMNNTVDQTFTGEAAGNVFGKCSAAGDVNADGFSDLIIGANNHNLATGKAYIYFGGAALNNVADVTFLGEASTNSFGKSVSTCGDANGDGYSDIIVSAPGYSSNTGRVYIYFGGASMNNTSDVTITGEGTSNYFGTSVSGSGDINGDGYSDVVVGAEGINTNTGKIYVFFGGASMNSVQDISLTGEATGNFFGCSVGIAGDVNADGYSDMIVGAKSYNSGIGRAYLYDYYMKGEINADFSLVGESTFTNFGICAEPAGDVNGDGFIDLIVGAYTYASNTGRAYIFYGGPNMNTSADVTMTGEAASNYFGNSLSSAGDVNGDGFADVIVGAYGNAANTGEAYIYFGGTSMNNVPDVTIAGEASSSLGNSVAPAGDINGDGYSDVVVGAPLHTTSTGRAYIYFGGSAMNNVADITFTGEATNNSFGSSVSSAGDVNGDGYPDIIIGAFGFTAITGKTYIYYGGPSMNNAVDLTMTGEDTGDRFGNTAASAGDINNDGYDDVIVGAYSANTNVGRAYIYLGSAVMNAVADLTISGEFAGNLFGNSVSSAGDVNSDGYDDFIVGAGGANTNTGRAYVFYGGNIIDTIPDLTMTGEASNNYLGRSATGAGDINADGFDDIIVGAYGNNSNTGKVNIYLSSQINVKPNLLYVKDVPNDQGGKVNLKWARSSYDVNGIAKITEYTILRSYPPGGGNFSWEVIATVPALRLPFYTHTAVTPFDSTSNNAGTLYFKIVARTSNPQESWQSNFLFGRSIDNIAPLLVSPFTAASEASDVRLNWKRSSAPDLMNYVLYRSTAPTIDPYTESPFATLTDSTYLDTSPLSGLYYYFIVAQDIHNNLSPVAVAESPNITISITLLMEGFYTASTNELIQDTVTMLLHNNVSPFAVIDSASAVVSSSGTGLFKFTNAPSGNYYVVIDHRNSLETWSSNALPLSHGVNTSYDFSNAITKAFGSNMRQIDSSPLEFAVYGADVTRDDFIDLSDIVSIFNDATNFVSGYVITDVTGDDFVDLSDITIAFNNANLFVGVIRP